jgi:hypothetical protein
MNLDPTPAAHLPAPLPSSATLLHRTQAALLLNHFLSFIRFLIKLLYFINK